MWCVVLCVEYFGVAFDSATPGRRITAQRVNDKCRQSIRLPTSKTTTTATTAAAEKNNRFYEDFQRQ